MKKSEHVMMKMKKSGHGMMKLVYTLITKYPTPAALNYSWNYGVLAMLILGIQIVTGIVLAMYYTPHIDLAFYSVEHICRDITYGYVLRSVHATGASFFFIVVYLHLLRGLWYGSYQYPRNALWYSGIVIFFFMIVTAFLGYLLPWGQMSFRGGTVITNLVTIIPLFGEKIVEFLWGGFSVANPTLNKFFALHFVLPFLLIILVAIHLYFLHTTGSNTSLGIASNTDKIFFAPYYIWKDLFTVILFLISFFFITLFLPNLLGDPDNYIEANPIVTPPHIVPEWYFLPFYGILRGIPNKLYGVLGLLSSILLIGLLPVLHKSSIRRIDFHVFLYYVLLITIFVFIALFRLGSAPIAYPYIGLTSLCIKIFFGCFLILWWSAVKINFKHTQNDILGIFRVFFKKITKIPDIFYTQETITSEQLFKIVIPKFLCFSILILFLYFVSGIYFVSGYDLYIAMLPYCLAITILFFIHLVVIVWFSITPKIFFWGFSVLLGLTILFFTIPQLLLLVTLTITAVTCFITFLSINFLPKKLQKNFLKLLNTLIDFLRKTYILETLANIYSFLGTIKESDSCFILIYIHCLSFIYIIQGRTYIYFFVFSGKQMSVPLQLEIAIILFFALSGIIIRIIITLALFLVESPYVFVFGDAPGDSQSSKDTTTPPNRPYLPNRPNPPFKNYWKVAGFGLGVCTLTVGCIVAYQGYHLLLEARKNTIQATRQADEACRQADAACRQADAAWRQVDQWDVDRGVRTIDEYKKKWGEKEK